MLVVSTIVALVLMTGSGYRSDLSAAAGFSVRCQPLGQYGYDRSVGGVALLDQQAIALSLETCREIGRGKLDGLVTLAHERQHLLGISDEQEAECEAIWDVRWLARRLGYRISLRTLRSYAGAFYAPCIR